MTAVSNSSPLILFARIGRLDLLRGAFDDLLVPPAVHAEVVTSGREGAAQIAAAGWIRVQAIDRSPDGHGVPGSLGAGEAEAIALALELPGASPILLDDAAGRRMARDLGLLVIGSAGVLVVAKGAALISTVRPLLDDLRTAGLFLSDAVYDRVVTRAGEG